MTTPAKRCPTTPVRFDYAPLRFKVKLGYTATFTYTPKDRSDAADYVIAEFERRLETDGNAGNGYEIAEGEQPDLYVSITVNSDDSNNRTMHVDVRSGSTNVAAGDVPRMGEPIRIPLQLIPTQPTAIRTA